MDWQSIESAPKDGKPILVWVRGDIFQASWSFANMQRGVGWIGRKTIWRSARRFRSAQYETSRRPDAFRLRTIYRRFNALSKPLECPSTTQAG